MNENSDEQHMRMALGQAIVAGENGEVPIGAIIVHQQRIIGRAYNQVELLKDPTAHAEILAITQAAAALGDWRLLNTTLYVTKEPCPMCAGAIVLARIPRLVYGTADMLRGGARSVFPICESSQLNHRPIITTGVLENECRAVLQNFFKERRQSSPDAP